MTRQEHEYTASRVVQYYENVADRNKIVTVRHFIEEGIPRRTIYNIIKRYEESHSIEFKKIPGRPAVLSSPEKVIRVKRVFESDPCITVNQAAKKLKMSVANVSKIKVKKLGIRARTKKFAPKYIKDQKNRVKTGARHINKKCLKKILIIDDETYLPLDPSEVPGRNFFHSLDPSDVKYEQRFKTKTKFAEKYLIWQAIDEEGNVSEPYISKGTLKSETYFEECIKKRLIPFITKKHKIEDVLFWPDLASVHYSKIVQDYFSSKNLEVVSKKKNPPNFPQGRGIEKFWSICKARYFARKTPPKNLRGLKILWSKISKEVAEQMGKSVMDKAGKIIRATGYKGVQQALLDFSNK